MVLYIVIKHSAYRRKLISKGNIACTRRRSERVSAKLLVNMGRFTNPSYNFLAGSEVPIKRLSVRNYVVFFSPSEFNKPATSSSFRKGSPKLTLRRKQMEFAWNSNENDLNIKWKPCGNRGKLKLTSNQIQIKLKWKSNETELQTTWNDLEIAWTSN